MQAIEQKKEKGISVFTYSEASSIWGELPTLLIDILALMAVDLSVLYCIGQRLV